MLLMNCSCGEYITFPQPNFGDRCHVLCPTCLNVITVTLSHGGHDAD